MGSPARHGKIGGVFQLLLFAYLPEELPGVEQGSFFVLLAFLSLTILSYFKANLWCGTANRCEQVRHRFQIVTHHNSLCTCGSHSRRNHENLRNVLFWCFCLFNYSGSQESKVLFLRLPMPNALRGVPNGQEHLMLLRKAILHFATFKAIVKATVQLLSQSRSQFGSMANPPDKLTPPSEF